MGATIVSKFYLVIISTLLVGCQQQPNPSIIPSVSKCSEKPVTSLEGKNVKTISLNTQEIKESGTAYLDTSVGFSFNAKSGQDFTYRTDDNICIWVYTPDNQILKSSKLPQNGKYIVQVSAPRGQTTFNLTMKLTTGEVIQSVQAQKTIAEPSSKTTEKASVSSEKALIDYYASVNNRNYEATWKLLSPQYRNKKSISYSDYTNWWNTVRTVKITRANLSSGNNERTYVDAELQYVMNSGELKTETVRYLMVWKSDISSWVIEDTIR